jgi:oxygen-dependent protoporphyrinogen oxidase
VSEHRHDAQVARSHVIVIGAGISGLAAAHALVANGLDVTVLESSPAVGGKLRISDIAGVPVDEGAEMFLQRVPEALDVVAALGRSDELVAPRTTSAGVWARGDLRPMPTGTVMGVPGTPSRLHGVLSPGEVARVAADRMLPGAPPGEDISVGEWVGRRVGRAVVERLVDPLLGGVYAGRADELSLAATIPQLPRDQRSVLAAVRRVAPTSPSPQPVFATLTGGIGTLPTSLVEAIRRSGGEILTDHAVRRIERTGSGWQVVHGATVDEVALAADAVIVATPAAPAARLLLDVAPVAAAELSAVEAASMAIIATAWRPGDVQAPDLSGYLVPAVYGRPVKAVTFSSSKWAHVGNSDVVIVRCSIGRHGDVSDLQRDDAELVDLAVAELTSYAGFRGTPVDSRVTRWGGGLPQYAVGHRGRVARISAAVDAEPGLAVCGATYDGVGIPACIRSAQAAASTLIAKLARINLS